MPDRLEEMLDALAAGSGAPPPPAPFLRAVAYRRWQRRAAGAAVVAVALTGLLWIWPRPAPPTPAPSTVATHSAPETSAVVLARLNADRPVDKLILPELTGGGPWKALRFGMRVEPAEIERWVCQ